MPPGRRSGTASIDAAQGRRRRRRGPEHPVTTRADRPRRRPSGAARMRQHGRSSDLATRPDEASSQQPSSRPIGPRRSVTRRNVTDRAIRRRRVAHGAGSAILDRDGPPSSRRSAATTRGAAAAPALRQTRAVALHLAPRLRPRLRAGAAPRRDPDGLLGRLLAAPEDQLRRRLADRASPARPSTSRSGWPARSTPRRCGRRSTPPCRTAWTSSRSSSPGPARWPSGWSPRCWRIELPGVPLDVARGRRWSASWQRDEVLVERMTKSGRRDVDTRGPVLSMTRPGGVGGGGRGTSCDNGHGRAAGDPYRPTR